jgi:hypothetical protein
MLTMDKDPESFACDGNKTAEQNEKEQKRQAQEGMDVTHNPPTDREALADPEALDDLVDLRHLE